MTIELSFPRSSGQPYEVTIETANVDLELIEAETEYDRFKELAAKVVAVPKSELDEKRKS